MPASLIAAGDALARFFAAPEIGSVPHRSARQGILILVAFIGGMLPISNMAMLSSAYLALSGDFNADLIDLGRLALGNLLIMGLVIFASNRNKTLIGALSLGINSGAYVAEIIRSGIQAVDKGQTEAARSLGLSQWQAMKLVVLPQAIKNVLPALANEVITMVKESSICSTYSMMELMWAAKNVAGTTGISVGPYVLVAAIYFCINFPASKAIEAIERRMRRGDKR